MHIFSFKKKLGPQLSEIKRLTTEEKEPTNSEKISQTSTANEKNPSKESLEKHENKSKPSQSETIPNTKNSLEREKKDNEPLKENEELKNKEKNALNTDVNEFKNMQKELLKNTQLNETPYSREKNLSQIQNQPNPENKENYKSAYEKLLSLANYDITIDTNKNQISSNKFGAKAIIHKKSEINFNGDSKKVELKEQNERTPVFDDPKNKEMLRKNEKNTPDKGKKTDEPIHDKNQNTTKEKLITSEKEEKNLENKHDALNKKTTPQMEETKTPIDEMFDLIEKYSILDSGKIATATGMNPETLQKISKMFEEDGVIEIIYPASLTKKPLFKMKNPVPSKIGEIPKGKEIQSYKLIVDHVPAEIKIILTQEEARPIYSINLPNIGKYTLRFLNYIKDEVAENMPIDLEEIVDSKKSKKLKQRFFYELNSHLAKYFPDSSTDLINMLSGMLLHNMYGLGDIEIIMGDEMLEEIAINSSKTPITVYHRIHGWLKTNILPGSEEEINNLSSQIGRKVGREITVLNPILDAHLLSGDRVNATLFPISSEGNTLTIRRFARKPWTIIDLIGEAHTMNTEMAATLWLAMQYEMNILIAGGTASGKTSALNSMLALVPTYHRIISIEDVREIILPKYLEWNWVPMVVRSANPEGLGEVTMLDLMVTSLRMRPDRIIVGEIRRKKEAEVLMEAIETGHSIYSTIHANSAYQVLRRLAEPPISIPLMQIELIDLIVVQYRDRKTNKRRTYEIAEIEQTSTGQGLQVNTIFKWVPRTDNWERLNKPTKLITMLNLHTGMTEEDITREINERIEILEWMKRQKINDIDMIGYIVKLFYSYPEQVKKISKKNTSYEEIKEMMQSDATEKQKPWVIEEKTGE